MLTINDYIFFQGRITEAKKVKGLNNEDIGKLTGYSKKTIEAFMSERGNKSEKVANAIAKALKIER